MDFTPDYAQRASRRTGGMKFKLAAVPSFQRRSTAANSMSYRRRTKLTMEQVRAVREWAGREGYGKTLAEQGRALHAQYPNLKAQSLLDILKNNTWFDPSYTPGEPDREWWGRDSLAHRLPLLLIRMLA
jgi:hypothetical protein